MQTFQLEYKGKQLGMIKTNLYSYQVVKYLKEYASYNNLNLEDFSKNDLNIHFFVENFVDYIIEHYIMKDYKEIEIEVFGMDDLIDITKL